MFNPYDIYRMMKKYRTNKWIASDIPRGLATGLASEYNAKIPCIEIPCGLAGGSLQYRTKRGHAAV